MGQPLLLRAFDLILSGGLLCFGPALLLLLLKAPHPSPLSAHRGFFGCRHFSKANQYLEAKGLTPIDWSVPE